MAHESPAIDVPPTQPQGFPLSQLWDYATGGAEVAARPNGARGPATARVDGPPPAGVQEAAQWMSHAVTTNTSPQRMLFLVGGPGGGKSHVARQVVNGLTRIDHQDPDLAHRTYTFETPSGRELLLINDATIPAEHRGETTLADDLEASQGRHLLACVNRGVLVDELSHEHHAPTGALITHWLRTGEPRTSQTAQLHTNATAGPNGYLRQATLTTGGGHLVELLAVFVDACSLLESRPAVRTTTDGLDPTPYRIERFEPGLDRSRTPAGAFLQQVVGHVLYEAAAPADPIAANLQSLQSNAVRDGVLSVLRAAELNSSQRLSYRQLWGAASRTIAGHLPEQVNHQDLHDWLASHNPDRVDGTRARFEVFRVLAEARLHQALFATPDAVAERHPLLSLTSAVDPARDMRPGYGTATGWASPVFQAFTGAGVGASPLEGLLEAAHSEALQEYATAFDERLDAAFRAAIDDDEDVQWRTGAVAWYGLYLSRMLAVATGHTAFVEELQAWTDAWDMCATLPSQLEARLQDIVAPHRDPSNPSSPSQVPLYASRSMGLVGRPTEPTLVVRLPPLKLRTRKEGEDLFLEVLHQEERIGEVLLDLPLVREALVSGGGWPGLTDDTESTVPRLERFRATIALSRSHDDAHVQLVTAHQDYDVTTQEPR